MIQVVKKCGELQPGDVYIGRPSPFGNPFTHIQGRATLAKFVVGSRKEAVERYREWIAERPELVEQLRAMKPKRLVCWCAPLACHGDILVELLEASNG